MGVKMTNLLGLWPAARRALIVAAFGLTTLLWFGSDQAWSVHGSSFGAGATVGTGHTNSTAVGAGATTTRVNQVMLGTASTTYTVAGIASAASKTAQGAPTSIVTSNGSGDLAAYTFAELGLASSGDVSNL